MNNRIKFIYIIFILYCTIFILYLYNTMKFICERLTKILAVSTKSFVVCITTKFKELKIFLWKKRHFQLCRDSNPGLTIAG